ncbi:hypothetical protein A0123_01827 [Gluconobacter cerinus]|uniref:Uncharacterized protein n=1 Tax=Gluconobacter cerinus TaxID=38307 RepID=A0A1B6VJ32_9PROT|nr:hypothetical protein A0123_01827 [Gluconobacter cerinus]
MSIILRKAPNAHDAMQRAGRLITMARTELCHTQRQFTVRPQAMAEDLHMARAVHRLQSEGFVLILNLRDEHVLTVLVPVTGGFPEGTVHELGCANFFVAIPGLCAAHVVLKDRVQTPALVVPEDLPDGFFLNVEEVHLAANAAMIALLGFFQAHQMSVQLLLVAPGRAVNAGQHGVAMVTTPVSTGHAHELEGRANVRRATQMRAAAEIKPFALTVDRNLLAFRQIADQFGLEVLTLLFKEADGFVTIPYFTGERGVGSDDFAHLGFDGFEVIRRERLLAGEVVIEAVLDARPDRDLRFRPERLHGFCENMRCIMADHLK